MRGSFAPREFDLDRGDRGDRRGVGALPGCYPLCLADLNTHYYLDKCYTSIYDVNTEAHPWLSLSTRQERYECLSGKIKLPLRF